MKNCKPAPHQMWAWNLPCATDFPYPDDLFHPDDLSERLFPTFLDFTTTEGQRGLDAFITRGANFESANWWLMSQIYDGGRRAPAMNIGYWALELQHGYGSVDVFRNPGTPREETIPGYNGFSGWAFLRGELIDYHERDKYGNPPYVFSGRALATLNGLSNPYGIANEEHRVALLNFGLNSAKIRLATAHWAFERRMSDDAPGPAKDFTVRNQNLIIFARQLALEHPDSEAQLAALNHFYDLWQETADAMYASPAVPAEKANGQGNGLTATYFDNADFTVPLATEIVPQVWYSNDSVNGQIATRSGTVLSGPTDFIKQITGTDAPSNSSPVPNGDNDGYAVQWQGYVQAPADGDYAFWLHMDGRGDHFVGSVMVNDIESSNGRVSDGRHFGEIDAYGLNSHYPVHGVQRVSLQAGEKYPITVRLRNSRDNSFWAQLAWEAPGVQWAQIIPQEYLYTEEDAVFDPPADDREVFVDFQEPPASYEEHSYSYQVQYTGGNEPVSLRLGSGSLPDGLSFTNGLIHGIVTEPFVAGSREPNLYRVVVIATDADGDFHSRNLTFEVLRSRDAPELPPPAIREIELYNTDDVVWDVPGLPAPNTSGPVSSYPNRPTTNSESFVPYEHENSLTSSN